MEEAKIRKNNMKIYPFYRMLSMDLLFFYAIEFLFITQVKGLSASDFMIGQVFYALFSVILQISSTLLIEKIGVKKSTILANFFNMCFLVGILCSNQLWILILAQFMSAMCFSIKNTSETTLLNYSIPESANKGEIYSRLEGRGERCYFIGNAITSIIAGILYGINPYYAIIASLVVVIITTIISFQFKDIEQFMEEPKETLPLGKEIQKGWKELKEGFKTILKSERLRSLLLYVGIVWGVYWLINGTYRSSGLEEIGVSPFVMSIIASICYLASAIGSKKQLAIHNHFRNKTLTFLLILMLISIFVVALTGILHIHTTATLIIYTVGFACLYAAIGAYNVVIKRYLANFAGKKILPKIYATKSIVENLGRVMIGIFGAYLFTLTDTANSMMIIGIMLAIITISVIGYMKPRVGIKPEKKHAQKIHMNEQNEGGNKHD